MACPWATARPCAPRHSLSPPRLSLLPLRQALLVFPLVPPPSAPAPAPAGHPSCSGALVGGKYCKVGPDIGCHDSSCQLPPGERTCSAHSQAACEAEAAKACSAAPNCVAFSLMHVVKSSGKFVYELAHTTSAVLKGFPDSDWTYYVDTKPWPTPTPAGPGATPLGGFQLPNSVSFLVNMATAMASDTSLFKLGMVSLITNPPLFESDMASFSQTLDLATATVNIAAATKAGRSFSASVAVDATSNTITALLNSSHPLALEVVVQSLHPAGEPDRLRTTFARLGTYSLTKPHRAASRAV